MSTSDPVNNSQNKEHASLIRGLGFFGLVASAFNCTVGGGIFRLPGAVYQLAGTAAPFVFILCFIVMLLICVVFVQVGSKISGSGGPYAYVRPVLGKYPGFICGVLLWALAALAMASVASAYAGFVANLFPQFGSAGARALVLFVTFALLSVFNIVGVREGSKVTLVITIAKLLPLLVLVGIGLPHLNAHELTPPDHLDWQVLARAAMVLIFAFTGAESALIPSGEIAEPEKNLPRSLYSALFLVLFLYLGVQLVVQSGLGSELALSKDAPLASAGEKFMGTPGRLLLSVGAILSTLGYLSAMTMSLPRTLFAFSVDGYLPKAFSKVHETYRTPANAIGVQALVTWLLAVSSGFEKLAVLANLSAILMYLMCVVAAVKLNRGKAITVGKIVPWLSLGTMAFLLTSVTQIEWLSVFALLVLASAGYYWKEKSFRNQA